MVSTKFLYRQVRRLSQVNRSHVSVQGKATKKKKTIISIGLKAQIRNLKNSKIILKILKQIFTQNAQI